MDLHRIIQELQAEKERLDEAILALEKLVDSGAHGRGRSSRKLEVQRAQDDSAVPEPSPTQIRLHSGDL